MYSSVFVWSNHTYLYLIQLIDFTHFTDKIKWNDQPWDQEFLVHFCFQNSNFFKIFYSSHSRDLSSTSISCIILWNSGKKTFKVTFESWLKFLHDGKMLTREWFIRLSSQNPDPGGSIYDIIDRTTLIFANIFFQTFLNTVSRLQCNSCNKDWCDFNCLWWNYCGEDIVILMTCLILLL